MYDAGKNTTDQVKLALHRNENHFIDVDFLQSLSRTALSSVRLNFYPDSESLELRSAIASFHGVKKENIYVGNGADGVLADLLRYFRKQHEIAFTPNVCYLVYPYLLKRFDFQHQPITNCRKNNGLFIIDSPSSITGQEYDTKNLSGETLIWDNVYGNFSEFSFSPKPAFRTFVSVHSFSKVFGIPSLRLGYCIADPNIVAELMETKDIFSVNSLAQKMGVLLIDNQKKILEYISKLKASRTFLKKEIESLGYRSSDSQASFLFFHHPEKSGREIFNRLLEKQVLVRWFNEPAINKHVRMSLPHPRDTDFLLNTLSKIVR